MNVRDLRGIRLDGLAPGLEDLLRVHRPTKFLLTVVDGLLNQRHEMSLLSLVTAYPEEYLPVCSHLSP